MLPPIAIAALPWRKIMPALAGVALVAGVLWAAYDAGRDSRNKEVAALILERNTAVANVATLETAIARQNAAIAAAGQSASAAQDAAGRAAKPATARDARLRAHLAAIARNGAAGCVVPPAVHDAWKGL